MVEGEGSASRVPARGGAGFSVGVLLPKARAPFSLAFQVSQSDSMAGEGDGLANALVASWLSMAVNGLISTASLMMGVGAVKDDARFMVLSGIAWLLSGVARIATGELVYSQLDVEVTQMKMEMKSKSEAAGREGKLRSTVQAAVALAVSFALGAVVPLIAACMIREYRSRLAAVVAATSLALVAFGCIGAILGATPVVRSGARVLFFGWISMAMTFGLMKLIFPPYFI